MLSRRKAQDGLGRLADIHSEKLRSKLTSFILSKTDSTADLGSQSQAATHGGFHYDRETMDSL
jgi:hypothetical protein